MYKTFKFDIGPHISDNYTPDPTIHRAYGLILVILVYLLGNICHFLQILKFFTESNSAESFDRGLRKSGIG